MNIANSIGQLKQDLRIHVDLVFHIKTIDQDSRLVFARNEIKCHKHTKMKVIM